MKTLGDRLRNAREQKNLTQIDVAKRTGINNKTISNYENNVSSPDPEALKEFAILYETSVDYLVGRAENRDIEDKRNELSNSNSLDVSGLPEEAVKQVEDYIEFIRQKYNADRSFKKKK